MAFSAVVLRRVVDRYAPPLVAATVAGGCRPGAPLAAVPGRTTPTYPPPDPR
ncbi:hypothetical protein AB0J20_19865 [Micromonospora costi]|uniref:hypothetical protein n=1 Tax=Micromonospora costi TaxID=1530042 RepID=UPI0033D22F76